MPRDNKVMDLQGANVRAETYGLVGTSPDGKNIFS